MTTEIMDSSIAPFPVETTAGFENGNYQGAVGIKGTYPASTLKKAEAHSLVSSSRTSGWISVRLVPLTPRAGNNDTNL